MPDKRRAPRRDFSFYMRVLDDETEATFGHLTNVSESGMRLETTMPISPGKIYNVHMELTPDISDTLFMFMSIRAKWCTADDLVPNLFRVGFEIVEISDHDFQIYQRLLQLYG